MTTRTDRLVFALATLVAILLTVMILVEQLGGQLFGNDGTSPMFGPWALLTVHAIVTLLQTPIAGAWYARWFRSAATPMRAVSAAFVALGIGLGWVFSAGGQICLRESVGPMDTLVTCYSGPTLSVGTAALGLILAILITLMFADRGSGEIPGPACDGGSSPSNLT